MIVAQPFPTYQPKMCGILSITNANPALVTTTLDGVNPGNHQYIDGLIIRIDIAPGYGMGQINQQFAPITVVGPTQFTIAIDTTMYDTFSFPVTYPLTSQYSQSVPFAELNGQIIGAVNNVLPY
jgi:hypothetical protein